MKLRRQRLYAIALDFDPERLRIHRPGHTITSACDAILGEIKSFGFTHKQGGVFFGDENVTPVTCVLAMQAVKQQHPWLGQTLSSARILRIEDNDDLMPAITSIPALNQRSHGMEDLSPDIQDAIQNSRMDSKYDYLSALLED